MVGVHGWKPGWERLIRGLCPQLWGGRDYSSLPRPGNCPHGVSQAHPAALEPQQLGLGCVYSMWPSHVASSARRGRNSVGLFVFLQLFCSG